MHGADKDFPFYKFYETEAELQVDKGKPIVIYTTRFEIIYPSDLAVRVMPSHSIHLNSDMKLNKLKAYVLTPDKNKVYIKKEDLKTSVGIDDNYFVNDDKEIKIPFKNLIKGSKVYVEYSVYCDQLRYFKPFFLRLFLDAQELNYKLIYPEDMSVSLFRKNMQDIQLQENQKHKKGYIIHSFQAENTKAIEYFEDGPSFSTYTPHFIPIVNTYKLGDKTHKYLSSVDDLYLWYSSRVYRNGSSTNTELNTIAADIASRSQSYREILANTYEWVKSHIRYIAYEAGDDAIIPRAPVLICQRKFGDCKDMSNLMRKLLELNGVESSLAWVGTRRIPYSYDELYTMNTDNHMILAARENEGDWILLDATDPSGKFGLPTPAIQGKQAMIALSDTSYVLYQIPLISAVENKTEYTIDLSIDEDVLDIESDLRAEGITGGRLNSLMLYTNEKEKQKLMLGLIQINENQAKVLHSEVNSNSEGIQVINKYKVNGRVKKVAGNVFVNPYITQILPFGSINTKERTIPKDIEFNRILRSTMNLSIPRDYRLSSLPQNLSYKGTSFSYTLGYQMHDGSLKVNEELIIDTPELNFSIADAEKWNELITALKNVYRTPLKLSKI